MNCGILIIFKILIRLKTFNEVSPAKLAVWPIFSYNDRLIFCSLERLELRRIKRDLIYVHKIIHKDVALNFEDFFQFSFYNATRGHVYKLYPKKVYSNVDINNFSNRIVTVWNKLPNYVIESPSISSFKLNLNKVNPYLSNLFTWAG